MYTGEAFPIYLTGTVELVIGFSGRGSIQIGILGRSRWARHTSKCHAEIQSHSTYSLPESTQTTHGTEAALVWYAWHNLTSPKCICKNRSCRGRKPARKQTAWLWDTSKQGFVGSLQPQLPLLPTASTALWLTWPMGQAPLQKSSPLSCSSSLLHKDCHTCSTAPVCSPNTHTLHVSSWFQILLFFFPIFHLDFWLVQVRQAISTLKLRGENTTCKRAVNVSCDIINFKVTLRGYT